MIAHRGASGYRPEHTIEGYRLAFALGADVVEADVVLTADGVPVARHENELSVTTDVAERPEFAGRRRTTRVAGQVVTGWFVEDFTLAELRGLRARERFGELRRHNQLYDDRFGIPTLAEIVALARAEAVRRGRRVGVFPEVKLASHFADLGLRFEDVLVDVLAPVAGELLVGVQSFEPWVLRSLARRTSLRLVQLVDSGGHPPEFDRSGAPRTYADLLTPSGLREVSTYAQAVGVHKSLLVPRTGAGRLGEPTGLLERAHDAGLAVLAWTFRNENAFLPAEFRIGEQVAAYGAAVGEQAAFLGLGIDGIVTDHPDTAAAARDYRARAGTRHPERFVGAWAPSWSHPGAATAGPWP